MLQDTNLRWIMDCKNKRSVSIFRKWNWRSLYQIYFKDVTQISHCKLLSLGKIILTKVKVTEFYLEHPFLLPACTSPVLQVSFISLHRSFTDEALLPSAAPIVAQSLPCFTLSLNRNMLISTMSRLPKYQMYSNNSKINLQLKDSTGSHFWHYTINIFCHHCLFSCVFPEAF